MKGKDRTTRYLAVSMAMLCVVCICIFSFMAVFMNNSSQETIGEVGTLYMTGMNDRIAMHFSTTIEYRLSHVQSIVDSLNEWSTEPEELRQQLAYDAESRSLHHLAFIAADGSMEMLHGNPFSISDPGPFAGSLADGREKVAAGEAADCGGLLLLGVPVEWPMSDGRQSVALVAGVPIGVLQNVMALDREDSLSYSHIIRPDGTFVIRSSDAYRESFFDRVRGEASDAGMAEGHVAALRHAMENHEEYSAVLYVGDGKERRHLHCSALPYSEWYLITVMPFGPLDELLSHLGRAWMNASLLGCGLILIMLLLVFTGYLRQTRQQMEKLRQAQLEAEHANRAKSEFLSSMSHDIRTPMNAIVGMTAIATANIDNRQQVQNCLKKIALSSKHLLGLINDVLDMSKIESGKMTLNMD